MEDLLINFPYRQRSQLAIGNGQWQDGLPWRKFRLVEKNEKILNNPGIAGKNKACTLEIREEVCFMQNNNNRENNQNQNERSQNQQNKQNEQRNQKENRK